MVDQTARIAELEHEATRRSLTEASLRAQLAAADQMAAAYQRERDLARSDLAAAVDGIAKGTEALRTERDAAVAAVESMKQLVAALEYLMPMAESWRPTSPSFALQHRARLRHIHQVLAKARGE